MIIERGFSFYSEGQKLAAILYLPPGLEPGERRPAVIPCTGYTGVKEGGISAMAKALTTAGFVSLIFDHRGAGESEGVRGRVVPQEQVEDILNAVTYLAQSPEVDKDGIGLLGSSLGGSNACYAAALDGRIKAVVCLNGVGNLRRWMRDGRRYYEWRQFLKRIEEDRIRRVMTGQSQYVHPYEMVAADPASLEYMEERYRTVQGMRVEVPFEIAEKFLAYAPESVVHRIAPRPVLFIHGGDDDLVPVDESYSLYEKASEVKKLAIIPGGTHFGVYEQPLFGQIMGMAIEWFREKLG